MPTGKSEPRRREPRDPVVASTRASDRAFCALSTAADTILRFAPHARVPAFLLLVTGLDVHVIWLKRLRPIVPLFLPLAAVVSLSLLPRRVALWAVSYRHRQPPPQSPKVVTLKGAMAIEVPWPPTDGDPWIYTSLMQEMGVEGAQAEELYTLEMSEFEAVAYV